MTKSEPNIDCPSHGEAYTTYICGHLASDPEQRWFCDYPSQNNPWPDAWCARCDQAFQKYGEWNDQNSDVLDAKLACHFCYEEQKGASVAPLMEPRRKSWKKFLQICVSELNEKQEVLNQQFGLAQHERWNWDQETGEIVFSNAGVPAVIAPFQFVGSVSTVSDTWLWSWANFHFEPHTTKELLQVREYGEAKDFANLTVPKWPAEEVDGWEMTAVAARMLGARGAYRTPGENGFTFMLLTDVRES